MIRTRSVVLVTASAVALSTPARAHFKLDSPPGRSTQNSIGSPQKSAPCGLSDSSPTADDSVPTNAVATLKSGATITISINETIFHPGHYRVAIAQDMASLPGDPQVTPGTMACGTAALATNPTLPVLADGLLDHTTSFGAATQTMQVKLPDGFTCTSCVLQVIEFMSDHGLNDPGGCFYHHCAIVDVTTIGPLDAGVGAGDDAGTVAGGHSGGCSIGRDGATASGLLLAVGVGLVVRRRARSRTRA